MTGLHSIVSTILLAVWALELVLPFNSHYAVVSTTRRAYYLVDLAAKPVESRPHHAETASLRWPGPAKVKLLVTTQPAGDLPLGQGSPAILLEQLCLDLFQALEFTVFLPELFYTDVLAPPLESPPRHS